MAKTENLTIEEKLKKYEEKLASKKEKWRYIYVGDKKTHMAISNFGNLCNTKTGKLMEFDTSENKYIRTSFTFEDRAFRFLVHRLVAMYFCKIPKRYEERGLTFKDLDVNHKNGIKHCNASFNLEWLTAKENTDHAWKTGLCDGIRGENAHLAKITEVQAIQICELIMQRKTNKEIMEIMNVSNKTIQHIRNGECWKHIVARYKFPKLLNVKPYSISDETVHNICKILELKKYSDPEIAKMFNVKRESVRDIRQRKRRKEISKNYNF